MNDKRWTPSSGTNKGVLVRLSPELLDAIDEACQQQGGDPSRPEMIRELLIDELTRRGLLRN